MLLNIPSDGGVPSAGHIPVPKPTKLKPEEPWGRGVSEELQRQNRTGGKGLHPSPGLATVAPG